MKKTIFFLLLRFLSPSPPTPLLPVTVARADLLPPATVTQAKTTHVKPQLRPTYRSPESAPSGLREQLLQSRDLLMSSAFDLAFRHSGGPPPAQLRSEELLDGLTCAGTGPNGSGRRARTGAISFLFEHHFSALISFQTTGVSDFEPFMS